MRRFAKRFLDRVMWLSVGVIAMTLIEGQAAGQCELKILASDGMASDSLGQSVSMAAAADRRTNRSVTARIEI